MGRGEESALALELPYLRGTASVNEEGARDRNPDRSGEFCDERHGREAGEREEPDQSEGEQSKGAQEDQADAVLERLPLVLCSLGGEPLGFAQSLEEQGPHRRRRGGAEGRSAGDEREHEVPGEAARGEMDIQRDPEGNDSDAGEPRQDENDRPSYPGRPHLIPHLRASGGSTNVNLEVC